ncbi:MAG: DUF4097 family beta strand repeat-containing protein [Oscillochloridaceae bacterium]|nr:DUF4097 domain-containing protein [Chloroflexaceae bacterium]MDW8388935.1 DUF4097 family beta strand repeat-containing protein [Oscillochloridaceae bacterium]
MSLETGPQQEQPPRTGPTTRAAPGAPAEPFYRRREQARRWGALLLLIGIVWLVFELTVRSSVYGVRINLAERSDTLPPRSFAASAVRINGVNDDIELVPAVGEDITVEATRRAGGWNKDVATAALQGLEVVTEVQGDTLVISVGGGNGLTRVLGRASAVSLRVAVPASTRVEATVVNGDIAVTGVQGDLMLQTVSGDVHAERVSGDLRVNSTSGDVRVRNHRGPLTVNTTSGTISAEGLITGARLSTLSGDIELRGVNDGPAARAIAGAADPQGDGDIIIDTTSGNIVFEGRLASNAAGVITTISGDVRVRLSDPADLRLDARTVSGELSSDLPLADDAPERRRLSALIGPGTANLTITTTSGDVEIGAARR